MQVSKKFKLWIFVYAFIFYCTTKIILLDTTFIDQKQLNYPNKSIKITFMVQDPDWTLPDNSLQLCYTDHLHLIKTGNIKFSESIVKALHDTSPQSSSQLTLSLSQSSLIKSSPPSFLTFPIILITVTGSHSNTLNPKYQKFLLNS